MRAMPATLALLHTTALTVPVFAELGRAELPGTRIVNLLDDSLLPDVIAAGEVTDRVERRLAAYVEQAAVVGADALMTCCSTIGEAIERLATTASLPLWRIDEAMAEEAARTGGRIGVLATVPTTLGPTARLVGRKAHELGRSDTRVEAVLVDGAYSALQAGRTAEHDQRILAALEALVSRTDVVVLAQASMARIVDTLERPPAIPVLTSPLAGLRRASQRLGERAQKPAR
jgi:aspartate/glutamate racemase